MLGLFLMLLYMALVVGVLWLVVAAVKWMSHHSCEGTILRLSLVLRLRTHSWWLATDSLGFCDQSAHYTQQFSSLRWVSGGL
jgi:hypothetical protein